ncbi:MAG: alpha-1,2-fucosyltransferase [Acidimicrobiia bacterium]
MDGQFVVVELQGRLGNQLFQFASGLGIARHRRARLRFLTRRVAIDDLVLPALIGERFRAPTTTELLRVGAVRDGTPAARVLQPLALRAVRLGRRLARRQPPNVVVWEDTGRYRPEVLERDLPLRIVGHLQSERYFADVAREIVEAIRLPDVPPMAHGLPTVGVSFRRGDYNNLRWALPLSYYEDAMRFVTDRLGPVVLVLFGDDRDFVELAGDRLSRFGDVVSGLAAGDDPVTQLAAMVDCDHHVIANSTFAWWGAWLRDQRHEGGRIVVAPSEFRGHDRLPDRWHTIDAGVERI